MRLWNTFKSIFAVIGILATIGGVFTYVVVRRALANFGQGLSDAGHTQTNFTTKVDSISVSNAESVVRRVAGLENVSVTEVIHSAITPTDFSGDRLNIYILRVTGMPTTVLEDPKAGAGRWYRGPYAEGVLTDILYHISRYSTIVAVPSEEELSSPHVIIHLEKLTTSSHGVEDVIVSIYDEQNGILYHFVDFT